jgi:enoyl-CoA hydratase
MPESTAAAGDPKHVKVLYGRAVLSASAAHGLATMLGQLFDDRTVHAVVLSSPAWGFEPQVDARPLVEACASLPQPTVAVIGGPCHEEGLELALACDIRIASPSATFRMAQVAEGRLPAAGGTQRLPRLAGPGLASRMLLLGDELTAAEALAGGLVSELSDDPAARAVAVADAIAARGPLAETYAKEAINRGMEMPLEQALRFETDLTVILQSTEDRAEGVKAFLEKRDPTFRGS